MASYLLIGGLVVLVIGIILLIIGIIQYEIINKKITAGTYKDSEGKVTKKYPILVWLLIIVGGVMILGGGIAGFMGYSKD
jgi:hypothetical protein